MQLAGSELLVGVLAEGVHDGLVGGARLGRFGIFPGRCEFGDDLLRGGQVRESRFGLGQGGGQVRDPALSPVPGPPAVQQSVQARGGVLDVRVFLLCGATSAESTPQRWTRSKSP
ncbi:hypothetical protein ACFS5L_02685 [Streptomyces phyllanthi]|uniref:hypothetical protein n=1 Tax=Streptomyces phyllanthi TaxID=1803180 RepID=UPI001D146254|nr:hypothetical protein [Streptomyces phyllanthi]